MRSSIEAVVMDVHLPAGVAGPDPMDFDVRCYVVAYASGVVLVDTAMAGSSTLIHAALSRLDADWAVVSDIVLTHHHADHAGGLATVAARAPKAVVWAGAADRQFMAYEGTIRSLTEGASVRRLRVLETPGHTPGHLSLIDEEASLIIAGDVAGSIDGVLTRGPVAFTADPDMAERSLRRVAALSAKRMVFGHGDEIANPAAALQQLTNGQNS